MAYPGSFPTARVDVSHLRNRTPGARPASSTPINSQPAGYMSEGDRIKRAKFERKLATVNAGKAQMENTSKGYSEAPDSEIWKRGNDGGGNGRRPKSESGFHRTRDALNDSKKLYDTLGISQGNQATPPKRSAQVLVPDDDGDAPLQAPMVNDANPAAFSKTSPTANSIKSSKEMREGFKKEVNGSRGENQSRIMNKGEKFQSGRFKGMTREEARKKYRLQFNSANS